MPPVWADPSYFLQTAAAAEKPAVTVETGLERRGGGGFKIVRGSKQKVFA